jgi:hypothetical protein
VHQADGRAPTSQPTDAKVDPVGHDARRSVRPAAEIRRPPTPTTSGSIRAGKVFIAGAPGLAIAPARVMTGTTQACHKPDHACRGPAGEASDLVVVVIVVVIVVIVVVQADLGRPDLFPRTATAIGP